MILNPDATPATALKAVAHSLGALDAAAELDKDRSADDRAFFAAEKAALDPFFDGLHAGQQALDKHWYLVSERLQARVELGDVVLDRGVRGGKARMKLELKAAGMADGADQVFPEDIDDIVDAERRVEPGLVLKVVERFPKVPDFPGKAALEADLKARATAQNTSFAERDAGEIAEAKLQAALETAVAGASGALYGLEKRLLGRFQREKRYVRAFFLDVAPVRKKAADKPAADAAPKAPGADA